MNCVVCTRDLTNTVYKLRCGLCGDMFHSQCINVSKNDFRKMSVFNLWSCTYYVYQLFSFLITLLKMTSLYVKLSDTVVLIVTISFSIPSMMRIFPISKVLILNVTLIYIIMTNTQILMIQNISLYVI